MKILIPENSIYNTKNIFRNISCNIAKPAFLGSIATRKLDHNSTDTFSYNQEEANSYEIFKEKLETVYPGASVEDTIQKVVENNDNEINEGAHKVVYRIPGLKGYVIGKSKDVKHAKNSILKECADPLPKYNFGQPIADNGSDLILMKEVKGTIHSIEDWVKVFRNVRENDSLSEKQASVIFEKIAAIKDFPLESYTKLAEKIKYLSENNTKVDNFNPNNLLVDFENQEFNVIDLFYNKPSIKALNQPLNNVHDMINLLCDALLNADCYDALDDERAEVFFNNTKNIIKKCYMAADLVGLTKDNENMIKIYKIADTQKWNKRGFDNVLSHSYKRFCQLYGLKHE